MALLKVVGYNFSASIVAACLAQYFPTRVTLNFVDFLKLMMHVLTDLDTKLRQHLGAAVAAQAWYGYPPDQVVHDLVSHVQFDRATNDYNFEVTLFFSSFSSVCVF